MREKRESLLLSVARVCYADGNLFAVQAFMTGMTKTNSFYDLDGDILRLKDDWIIDNSAAIDKVLTTFPDIRGIDAAPATKIDLWGAMRLQQLAQSHNAQINLNDHQRRIFEFLPDQASKPQKIKTPFFVELIETIGERSSSAFKTAFGITAFVGEVFLCLLRNFADPRRFRFHSIVRHIHETGLQALPIIGLLAVLISMVIAYQASIQLNKFGASIFTVDLLVISLLREMGVLVTAIMVAGRSGSAFAAEIGVMKLREETDALRTMGFNPIEILVVPRLIAMMLTLPILTFLADIIGLLGGGVISIILLDIPFDMYVERVSGVAKSTMFFVGMIKAPVFAFVITIVGAYQGMNVTGSAESVGRLTTVAVVQSIFLVIMLDALFSILFAQMGI
jgi:phospholipid/cholesterol/gamma-HCH transport system permease protein